jgi:transglutaminase-like putative cysteine protease
MQYRIKHSTRYRYAYPAVATKQVLRLSPRRDPHQRVMSWQLNAPGPLNPVTDAYRNVSHLHVVTGEHGSVLIEAIGAVEVEPLVDGRLDERDGLPPVAFLGTTPLTALDEGAREFVQRHLRGRNAAHLLDFAVAVREAVAYQPGATHVQTRAADALALGRGVCQDHAHVFVAGCRALGIPARYVSGYYHRPHHTGEAATHAWADAWVAESGWISIDITHGCFASDELCRLAVGRDYDSASPVRGVRVGGGEEAMDVSVEIKEEAEAAPAFSLQAPEEIA